MTSLRLRPDLTELAALADGLQSFGSAHEIDPDLLSLVHLTLEEVITALSAAPPRANRQNGHIHVHLTVDGRALVARVEKSAEQPLRMSLDLVSSLMDEVGYGHEDGRHFVTLRKMIK